MPVLDYHIFEPYEITVTTKRLNTPNVPEVSYKIIKWYVAINFQLNKQKKSMLPSSFSFLFFMTNCKGTPITLSDSTMDTFHLIVYPESEKVFQKVLYYFHMQ